MEPDNIHETIRKIKKKFLAGVPVNDIFTSETLEILNGLEVVTQLRLIKETVNNSLIKKYPIKYSYQKEFLRKIIDHMEIQGAVIHDIIYEEFGRLIALPDAQLKFYKHYCCPSGNIITLIENANIISSGTTGLVTWTAALALADWCIQHEKLFTEKRILELGSGLGLTGFAIQDHCNVERIFLSDYHDSVLRALKENIAINESNMIRPNLEVHVLPWENIDYNKAESFEADFILAADVVYDPDLMTHLVNAIENFLRCKECEAIIACTERNKETINIFLNLIVSRNIKYEVCRIEPKYFHWPEEPVVRIFRLKLEVDTSESP